MKALRRRDPRFESDVECNERSEPFLSVTPYTHFMPAASGYSKSGVEQGCLVKSAGEHETTEGHETTNARPFCSCLLHRPIAMVSSLTLSVNHRQVEPGSNGQSFEARPVHTLRVPPLTLQREIWGFNHQSPYR